MGMSGDTDIGCAGVRNHITGGTVSGLIDKAGFGTHDKTSAVLILDTA